MIAVYIVIVILIIYNTLIYKCFRLNNQQISYDLILGHFLQVVDQEN